MILVDLYGFISDDEHPKDVPPKDATRVLEIHLDLKLILRCWHFS